MVRYIHGKAVSEISTLGHGLAASSVTQTYPSTGSFRPQSPSMDPSTLSCESGDAILHTSSKLFWEARAPMTSPSSEASEQMDGGSDDPLFSSRWSVQWRSPRHAMAGGMSVAGEQPEADIADYFHQRSASAASTLPPPYSSEFGDTWYVCLCMDFV